MGGWRTPTLRSLIELLDRVVGRGVIIDSDVPVSPAVVGIRCAAAGRGRRLERPEPTDPPASQRARAHGAPTRLPPLDRPLLPRRD